jgi:hypothetical protein
MTMKNLIVAAAIAAALGSPAAYAQQRAGAAATPEEVRLMREQLQALSSRLDRLEQSNQQLAAENAQLKAQAGDGAKTAELGQRVEELQTDLDNTVDQLAKTRANAPEWAGRFAFRGDLRYRHEQIMSDGDRAVPGVPAATNPSVASLDRVRDRIRLRFGGTFRVNDTVVVGMQLATGADDPRSTNQTLGDSVGPGSARRTVGVDQAFFAWQPTSTWLVRGGKMPMPWTRPGTSLFFDGDINPEGVAVNYTKGLLFGSASYMWLQERGPTVVRQGEAAVDVSDPAMGHVQAGIRYPFTATSSLTGAISYYDHFATQGRRPFFAGNPNGNTTVNVAFPAGSTTQLAVAAYDYNILQAFLQYDQIVFDTLPLMLYVDYAQNDDAPRSDTAYSVGFTLGRASNPRTWEVGAMYQDIGKDALFGQWVDSDFGNGNTDTKGWVLRAGYAVKTNWTLNATYFINELNNDVCSAAVPCNRGYDRLQLDTNFRF